MKKALILVATLAAVGLTACNFGDDIDDGQGGEETTLPSQEQSINKLVQLGEGDGFKIELEVDSSDSEPETEYFTFKNHTFMLEHEDGSGNAFVYNESQIHSYTKEAGAESYEKHGCH